MINKIPDYLTEISLPLPITKATRQIAQNFAAAQATPEKAEQVQLNTLAVLVVNNYLNMLGIATDLTQSDSWNPVMQICADVADLEVKGAGKLECLPLKEITSVYSIPEASADSRIGYVIVVIDDSLRQAHILGFVPTLTSQEISLDRLQAPEDLVDRIHDLKSNFLEEKLNNLSQWFDDIFAAGWETIDSLFNGPELAPAFGFRGGNILATPELYFKETKPVLRRGKLINLGQKADAVTVILLIELQAQSDTKTDIRVQLHPSGQKRHLPENIKLIVLEESGTMFMEAKARNADDYIQLQFSGVKEENFTLQVALNDVITTERFVI